jgi:hypothetical protein
MPPRHFKSLSLPDSTDDGIQRARADLQQRGLAAIPPELLEPKACPSCGGHVEHVTVGIQHIKCHGCGYAQQTVSVNGNGVATFATGALVGAAVAALFMYMARDEKPARAALPAKKRARKTAAKKRAPRAR